MKAIVYRNALGPFQVWLLDGDELPPSASLPGDPDQRSLAVNYKGDEPSWEDWGGSLAEAPWLGDWAVRDVPDGSTPAEALAYVRSQDVAQAAAA